MERILWNYLRDNYAATPDLPGWSPASGATYRESGHTAPRRHCPSTRRRPSPGSLSSGADHGPRLGGQHWPSCRPHWSPAVSEWWFNAVSATEAIHLHGRNMLMLQATIQTLHKSLYSVVPTPCRVSLASLVPPARVSTNTYIIPCGSCSAKLAVLFLSLLILKSVSFYLPV